MGNDTKFGKFLCELFPQVREILSNEENYSKIVIKYYPHIIKQQLSINLQPPPIERQELYQTLGSLDEITSNILKK